MTQKIVKFIGKLINALSYLSPSYAAKLAVKLFSKPRKGKLKPNESNFLNHAKYNIVNCQNFNIQTYHWKGNRASILLVHGWESNAGRWQELITLLQEQNFNIYALDAPAHGQSGSSIFNAVLYSECINKVVSLIAPEIIIGHSIGGTASALAIHNYTLNISKLIMLGAPSNFTDLIKHYEITMGYNATVVDAIEDYFLNYFSKSPSYYTFNNISKNLPAKGLIIHDKRDRIIPFKHAKEILTHYNHATLITTVGFGHGLKNNQVYTNIIEFINAN